jgi:hypothetical protein
MLAPVSNGLPVLVFYSYPFMQFNLKNLVHMLFLNSFSENLGSVVEPAEVGG